MRGSKGTPCIVLTVSPEAVTELSANQILIFLPSYLLLVMSSLIFSLNDVCYILAYSRYMLLSLLFIIIYYANGCDNVSLTCVLLVAVLLIFWVDVSNSLFERFVILEFILFAGNERSSYAHFYAKVCNIYCRSERRMAVNDWQTVCTYSGIVFVYWLTLLCINCYSALLAALLLPLISWWWWLPFRLPRLSSLLLDVSGSVSWDWASYSNWKLTRISNIRRSEAFSLSLLANILLILPSTCKNYLQTFYKLLSINFVNTSLLSLLILSCSMCVENTSCYYYITFGIFLSTTCCDASSALSFNAMFYYACLIFSSYFYYYYDGICAVAPASTNGAEDYNFDCIAEVFLRYSLRRFSLSYCIAWR